MAMVGNYTDLLRDFLAKKIIIKKEDLKRTQIYGLPKELEKEFQSSCLSRILVSLFGTDKAIVAYDVDIKSKTFKYLNKNGEVISVCLDSNNGVGKIGIAKDNIERTWNCNISDSGDVALNPSILCISNGSTSISRKFSRRNASILLSHGNDYLSVRVGKEENFESSFLLPYEDQLINNLILSNTMDLSEAYGYLKDITGLKLNNYTIYIKTNRSIGPKENVLSEASINQGSMPSISITLSAPNDEVITYSITAIENKKLNITIKTICGESTNTVKKPIMCSLSILELHQFLLGIIKKKEKIKERN